MQQDKFLNTVKEICNNYIKDLEGMEITAENLATILKKYHPEEAREALLTNVRQIESGVISGRKMFDQMISDLKYGYDEASENICNRYRTYFYNISSKYSNTYKKGVFIALFREIGKMSNKTISDEELSDFSSLTISEMIDTLIDKIKRSDLVKGIASELNELSKSDLRLIHTDNSEPTKNRSLHETLLLTSVLADESSNWKAKHYPETTGKQTSIIARVMNYVSEHRYYAIIGGTVTGLLSCTALVLVYNHCAEIIAAGGVAVQSGLLTLGASELATVAPVLLTVMGLYTVACVLMAVFAAGVFLSVFYVLSEIHEEDVDEDEDDIENGRYDTE